MPEIHTLKVWIQNGKLYVSGLAIRQRWTVYDVLGTLIYQGIAESDTAEITLPIRGTYIFQSGNKSIKIVY
jgi:hypothetical protein